MAIYKVVEVGDDVLREKAITVTKLGPHIDKLLDNMRDTMYANQGVGLAAPQIGVPKRVIVVDIGDGLIEFINPVLAEKDGQQIDNEGCLSVPGLMGDVARAERVKVKGVNRAGEATELEASGFLARALQHEIDHLDGILFIDKAKNLKQV